MDRKIEKKANPLKIILITVGCLVVIYLGFAVYSRSGSTRLKVDPSRMTISQVQYGEFQEYYPFDGTVVPVTTVYLDVEDGGRVEEKFVEGGKYVEKDDKIVRFSNTSTQLNNMRNETEAVKTLDALQATALTLNQQKLNRKENLLTKEYNIKSMERQLKRYDALRKENIVVSDEEYENLVEKVEYNKALLEIQKERNKMEDALAERNLKQTEWNIDRVKLSMELYSKQIENLVVTAPISGQLSSISVEIGQKIGPGTRIGWIDKLDKLKINAGIDQYYLAKVKVGTKGKFTLDGEKYDVEVIKIYPEVDASRQFRVDMAFVGDPPEGVKRGQTLTTELSFSEAGQSLMVKKGGFYQQTSGRWVYIISEDGKTAHKQDMRLGRQNPRDVEVLEGLKEGDWIITSGYDTFKEADELIFKEPLKLNG